MNARNFYIQFFVLAVITIIIAKLVDVYWIKIILCLVLFYCICAVIYAWVTHDKQKKE